MIATTGSKSPARMQRVGMWLIEVIEDTFPVTYQGTLTRDSISAQELTLQLLANALTVIKNLDVEMETIEMYFDCQIVASAFLNKWIEKWSESEWKSAKGEDIADKNTWMLIWKLLNAIGKRYIAMKDRSSYANWMKIMLKKEEEKIRNQIIAEESIAKIKEKLA